MIRIKDLSFRYSQSSEWVVKDFNLTVTQGECIVLTGISGCGKTTVTKVVNGLIPHFEKGVRAGEVRMGNEEIAEKSPHAIAMTTGAMFQDPRSQFFTTSVIDEIIFGCENLGIERDEIKERLQEELKRFSLENLTDKNVFILSNGEKQRCVFAAIHAMGPSVFVLDEPSSNLDPESISRLKKIIKRLKEQGKTIIIAEHRLFYLKELADRLIIMDKGRLSAQFSREAFQTLTNEKLESHGLRCFDLAPIPLNRKSFKKKDGCCLTISDLYFSYKRKAKHILKGINLTIQAGEILGIAGRNGTGKTTLAKLISGLLKETRGRIQLDHQPLTPRRRIRACHLVMQQTDHQLFTESVGKELQLMIREEPDPDPKIDRVLREFGLEACRDCHPQALSGGQKQRLTIACAAIRAAKIILLDEPTSGLDGKSISQLRQKAWDMAGKGHIVIIVTHDHEFLVKACSRIVILDKGKVVMDRETRTLDKESKAALLSVWE